MAFLCREPTQAIPMYSLVFLPLTVIAVFPLIVLGGLPCFLDKPSSNQFPTTGNNPWLVRSKTQWMSDTSYPNVIWPFSLIRTWNEAQEQNKSKYKPCKHSWRDAWFTPTQNLTHLSGVTFLLPFPRLSPYSSRRNASQQWDFALSNRLVRARLIRYYSRPNPCAEGELLNTAMIR